MIESGEKIRLCNSARKRAAIEHSKTANVLKTLMAATMAGSLSACASTQVAEVSEPAVTAAIVPAPTQVALVDAKLGVSPSPKVVASAQRIKRGGGYQKIGKPYRIAGKLYVPQADPDYNEVGTASWYGRQFHGRLTANGERFDMNSLMAAHPTLPLPSYARVTNEANGRSVIVRINDRGPFAHNRVIDLSRKTASVLNFKDKGTAKVRVEYIGEARLDGKDRQFLVASYKGPGPGPTLRNDPSVVAAYAAPPSAKAKIKFPDGSSGGRLDRSVLNSGTPFDPYRVYGAAKNAAPKVENPVEKSSYGADHRVSLAFAAIDGLLR